MEQKYVAVFLDDAGKVQRRLDYIFRDGKGGVTLSTLQDKLTERFGCSMIMGPKNDSQLEMCTRSNSMKVYQIGNGDLLSEYQR